MNVAEKFLWQKSMVIPWTAATNNCFRNQTLFFHSDNDRALLAHLTHTVLSETSLLLLKGDRNCSMNCSDFEYLDRKILSAVHLSAVAI